MAVDTENIPVYFKAPGAIIDYHLNYRLYLEEGETITDSLFIVAAGITVGPTLPSFTTQDTTIWLSGGEIGQLYSCVNRIVTSAGRTDYRSILIKVRSR